MLAHHSTQIGLRQMPLVPDELSQTSEDGQFASVAHGSWQVRESGSQMSLTSAHGLVLGSPLAGSQNVPTCGALLVPLPEPVKRSRHSRLTRIPFGGTAPWVNASR